MIIVLLIIINNYYNYYIIIIILFLRLSTIQNADLIVVVDDGNIVETGCHGDLMKQHGQYYDMVVTQVG